MCELHAAANLRGSTYVLRPSRSVSATLSSYAACCCCSRANERTVRTLPRGQCRQVRGRCSDAQPATHLLMLSSATSVARASASCVCFDSLRTNAPYARACHGSRGRVRSVSAVTGVERA